MEETFAHRVKVVMYLAVLRLDLKHLVHLDELVCLVVLDELNEKGRSVCEWGGGNDT